MTLLLATAEQATIELDNSERENRTLRDAISDVSERLYTTLDGFANPEQLRREPPPESRLSCTASASGFSARPSATM